MPTPPMGINVADRGQGLGNEGFSRGGLWNRLSYSQAYPRRSVYSSENRSHCSVATGTPSTAGEVPVVAAVCRDPEVPLTEVHGVIHYHPSTRLLESPHVRS